MDAGLMNTAGKITIASFPYNGYVPVTSLNSGSCPVQIDNPYTSSNATQYGDTNNPVFAAHPNSLVATRPSTPFNFLRGLGVTTSSTVSSSYPSPDVSALAGMPTAEVVTLNEAAGKIIELQPRPCDHNLWTWRSCGLPNSAVTPGTTGETVILDRGSDAFPGALTIEGSGSTAVGAAGLIQVDTGVDATGLRAFGYETLVINIADVTSNVALFDLELCYNIEAVPCSNASSAVAGVNPGALIPSNAPVVSSRAAADVMLQEVSAMPNRMVRTVTDAIGGLAGQLVNLAITPGGIVGKVAMAASGMALDALGRRTNLPGLQHQARIGYA